MRREIQHYRQIRPSFIGADASDICHPDLVRLADLELPRNVVGRCHCWLSAIKPRTTAIDRLRTHSTVETARREDWILDQVDRGIDVLLTNPELVKTGLDLLDFPTIAFLQTGYNVYTLQQAARRSWRIGQKHPVRVIFFGYAGSSQITCLQLMAKKIAVTQSTSGDVPESGLDSLNQDGDSVEMALARQLIAA